MSKFISKSRIKPSKSIPFKAEWSNHSINYEKIVEDYKNPLSAKKERVESIPLDKLSFRDIYSFPFRKCEYSSWVYDDNDNFIFQFKFDNEKTEDKLIQILNEELTDYNKQEVAYKNGLIEVNGSPFIMIRGWGNLTSSGGYNLDEKYAVKIQDTLAEYIIEKIGRKNDKN